MTIKLSRLEKSLFAAVALLVPALVVFFALNWAWAVVVYGLGMILVLLWLWRSQGRDSRTGRFLIKMLILSAFVALGGCQAPRFDAPWAQADTHAESIGEKVNAAATQVSGTAAEIVTTAREGRNATPEAIRPKLDPFWSRIVASGHMLYLQSDALIAVRKDIDALRAEVQAGQRELKSTLAALEDEKTGRAKDNKAWEEKLAKANGKWEAGFRTISWLAIVSIGISVALGFMLHDFRISIAGGAGGMAVVIACMVVGQIQAWLPWVAGGLVVLAIAWVLIEAAIRRSFWQAIRTSPVQDFEDLLRPQPVAKVG